MLHVRYALRIARAARPARVTLRPASSQTDAAAGPIAAYDALIAGGRVKRDEHQLGALTPLQRLHDELVDSGYAPEPRAREAKEEDKGETIFSRFAGFAQTLGVAVGGGSARPSGAAGRRPRGTSRLQN